MEITALQFVWFMLAGVVLLGYSLLGGYDMGVGSLYLFSKKSQRKEMLESVGPYWDANQVWLITFGGGLFAAFPFVYATVFSGFYFAMMLLLVALVIRTVAIEFRYQLNTPRWSKVFDLCFGIGSILASILVGVALGNILRGIPLVVSASYDSTFVYAGGFFDLLNPYSIGMGVFSLALFLLHGCSFLNATGTDEVRRTARRRGNTLWLVVLVLFIVLSGCTFAFSHHLTQNFLSSPLFFALPLITLLGLLVYPLAIKKEQAKLKPLLASAAVLIGIVGIIGASLFPRLVPNLSSVKDYDPASLTDFASTHLQDSLTITNAASSESTLFIMLLIAGIGVPIMLIYTIYVYRTLFKTKKPETASGSSAEVSIKA